MGTAPADEALPYPGDLPAAVTALADGIRTGSAQLAVFADGIDAAHGSLHAAWSGDDATAADQEVGALAAVCRALVSRADTAQAAVNSHQNDLTTIRHQVDILRQLWTEASQALVAPVPDSSTYLQLQVNHDAWQPQVDTANSKIATLTDIQSTLTTGRLPI